MSYMMKDELGNIQNVIGINFGVIFIRTAYNPIIILSK